MERPDDTVIPVSKRKLAWLVLAAYAFVALGVVFLMLDEATIRSGFRVNDPFTVRAVGVASVVLFGAAGVYGVRRLFDKRPGLVLDASGVLDNSSGVAGGRIPWSEVVGVRVVEVHRQRMLVVQVRNPDRLVAGGAWFKARLQRMNEGMYGSPVVISAGALAIEFDALVALFDRYMQEHAGLARQPGAPMGQ